MLRVDFVTLFPQMVMDALSYSIPSRAVAAGSIEFNTVDPRQFTHDNHRTVDDSPYGGGPGMLMKPGPISDALDSLPVLPKRAVVFTEPTGELFTQAAAQELSVLDQVVFVCGHYEGIDHRVEQLYATHVYSLGDYVLSGGEIAALVMADAIARLMPGALGNQDSLSIDSHSDGTLSAPQYTRPEVFRDLKVPDLLLSGHHEKIRKWKRKESLRLTRERRPDLFEHLNFSKEDLKLLRELDDSDNL